MRRPYQIIRALHRPLHLPPLWLPQPHFSCFLWVHAFLISANKLAHINQRLKKSQPLRMTMLIASSESEDEAGGSFGAVLIGVEIARAHGVSGQANRPALFKRQVNA